MDFKMVGGKLNNVEYLKRKQTIIVPVQIIRIKIPTSATHHDAVNNLSKSKSASGYAPVFNLNCVNTTKKVFFFIDLFHMYE